MPREHLTLLDLSDREFLLILDEVGDGEFVDSLEVANRLDLLDRRSAGIRLSYAARNGLVEREVRPDAHGNITAERDGKVVHTQRWRLTQLGRDYAYGKLRAAQRKSLDGISEGALLELTRYMTERAQRSESSRWLMRREWHYGMERRNGR